MPLSRDKKQILASAQQAHKASAKAKREALARAVQTIDKAQGSFLSMLKPAHRKFVLHFIATNNAGEAAIAAGYTESASRNQGYRLRQLPKIQLAISEQLRSTIASSEQVAARITEMAFANPAQFWAIKGDTVEGFDVAKFKEKGYLLKRIDMQDGKPKIELHDPLAALGLLGKHLGMFVDKQEITGPSGGPVQATVTVTTEQAAAVAVKTKVIA